MYYFLDRSNIFKTILGIFGILVLGLLGCQQKPIPTTHTQVPSMALTPYLTVTPSLNPDLESLVTPDLPTVAPLPSPTPFVYTVVADDTLTGIAFRHSVSLEDLIAANPGIDPNFLTIGLTLTIPLEGVIVAALPTPTPIALTVDPPACYPTSDGYLQCMAVVRNDQAFDVENVVAQITLRSENNNHEPMTQSAISPMNLIPAGMKAAVSTTFEPPIPQDYVSSAKLLTVIPVLEADQRYLETELQNNGIEATQDGKQARLTGSITLLPDQAEATVIWVTAFAYDAQNNIVGVRKWAADQVLKPGNQIDFELVVYSLGRSIKNVEILTEARP